MPELPEVEHTAGSLRRWLQGEVITRAEAEPTRVFRGADHAEFARALTGRRLERIERRGKYLLLYFDGGVGVVNHLGMTGKWLRRGPGEPAPPPAHSRARLTLRDGTVIHYSDPRMFGRIAVHRADELAALPEIQALGPDPLHDGIDPEALRAVLAKSARPVKVALLDQAVIAGVGNIYATEALFRAGVHPARLARSITRDEAARIARGIHDSMEEVLAAAGDRPRPYLSEGGAVENPFQVYDRAGEPCPRCGRRLEKAVIGGRTSVFCPHCQPRGGAAKRR